MPPSNCGATTSADAAASAFTLPREQLGREWAVELSTADPAVGAGAAAESHPPGDRVVLEGRSLLVLRCVR